jgi:PST family polysaccharide transporter
VLQALSIVVLSRLLSPHEYGVVAGANLVIGLLTLFAQVGVGPALVQMLDLRDIDVVAAFYFSTLFGAALGGVLFGLANVIGPLVGLGSDKSLLDVLALVLPIGGMAVASGAVAQRRFRFRALAIADIVSYSIGYLGVAIFLASRGAGAWSLVWGQVAASSFDAALYYLIARHRLRPGSVIAMLASLKKTLSFGSGVSLAQFGNWMALTGDNWVVLHVLGVGTLGLYSRAYQLLSQPANLVGGVADKVLFPAMSRIRHDEERLARAYVRAIGCISLATIPASVVFFVLAPEIVRVVLGPQWSGATAPFRIFALVLFPRTAYKVSGSLTRATGAVYGGAWRQWLYAAEVIGGSAVGQHWGPTGVAVAASLAITAHYSVMLKFSGRIGQNLIRRVLLVQLRYALLGAAIAGASYGVATALRAERAGVVAVLLATVAAAGVVGAGGLFAFEPYFASEITLVRSGLTKLGLRRRGVRPDLVEA